MKKWIVGIYARLSADEQKDEESNSVKSQRNMLLMYLKDKPDFKLFKEYIDDGHTGTDFNRQGFQDMLNDIKLKKINTIIVKDLSRLGRNYIGVGNFLENFIPKNKIRLISINDNIDTKNNTNNAMEIAFKNLLNESYARDASKKIRSSLKSNKKSGYFIGSLAPFGYLKDPDDCHKFLIDNDAAETVKKIFDLALKGLSKQEIIEYLNNKNIYTPSMYFKYKYNISRLKLNEKWSIKMIDNILKNETYIGDLIQGRRTRISHKNHNFVRVPEDEWIICKKHHKSIINEKIFNQVNNILYNRNIKVKSDGKLNKYSGILKCSECNNNLFRFKRIKNEKIQIYYYCGSYIKNKTCHKHYITEQELDLSVISAINNELKFIDNLDLDLEDFINNSRKEYENQLKIHKLVEINDKIIETKKMLDDITNDYKDKLITKDDYELFSRDYLYDMNNLLLEKETLERTKINDGDLSWLIKLKNTQQIDTLNRNIINEFINNIYVDDNKNIEIVFNFQNKFNQLIEYLKNEENMI